MKGINAPQLIIISANVANFISSIITKITKLEQKNQNA